MFYKTVGTILLLNLIDGFLTASIDNDTPEDDRVIGGDDVPIIKFPHQVSLQFDNNHFCGGSIYNNRIIVTAAHCVTPFKADDVKRLSVLMGTSTLESGGVRIPFQSFVPHQFYNNRSLNYDLALIKTKTPITFTDSIKPIDLAMKVPASGAQVIVTGWGVLKNGDTKPSPKLQGAQLDFIPRAACGSRPNNYTPASITSTMICAGAKQKGSCKGDSGGPLMDLTTKKLVGVVSWGSTNCAATGSPGVFCNIPALRNWVRSSAFTLLKNEKSLRK